MGWWDGVMVGGWDGGVVGWWDGEMMGGWGAMVVRWGAIWLVFLQLDFSMS